MLDRRRWKDKTEKWLQSSAYTLCSTTSLGTTEYVVHWWKVMGLVRKPVGFHHSRKRAIDKAYRKAGGR